MACDQEHKDLISLHQKLLSEKNSCVERKHPDKKKTGWKAFTGERDDFGNHLISQAVVRENKNVLDLAGEAANPTVYRDVELNILPPLVPSAVPYQEPDNVL